MDLELLAGGNYGKRLLLKRPLLAFRHPQAVRLLSAPSLSLLLKQEAGSFTDRVYFEPPCHRT
ncbi:MAG TPA: hypothetical protein VIL30_06240, partial [Ramlibacter sp.]